MALLLLAHVKCLYTGESIQKRYTIKHGAAVRGLAYAAAAGGPRGGEEHNGGGDGSTFSGLVTITCPSNVPRPSAQPQRATRALVR